MNTSSNDPGEDAGIEQMQNKESQISKILSDDTIKRIIIIILILMVSIPLMDLNNYTSITTHWDFMTVFLLKALHNPDIKVSHLQLLMEKNL